MIWYFLLMLLLLQHSGIAFAYEDGDIVEVVAPDPIVGENDGKSLKNNREERDLLGFFKQKTAAQPPVAGDVGGYGAAYNGGYSGSGHYGVKTSRANYGHGHGGSGSPGDYGSGSYGGGGYGSFGGYKSGGYGSGLTPNTPQRIFGVKTSAQINKDFLLHERPQIPAYANCPAYILPTNMFVKCRDNQCELSCPAQYTFPDGTTLLKLVCMSGSWIIRDSDVTTVPPCQATCMPPCENNGICIEAGICKCAENFYGPWCQNKKSFCGGKPPIPKNSRVSCSNNICNAQCMMGFQYPDGSTITNLECIDGVWLHKKTRSPKPPDCGPICQPACENGGQCISFNVCQCAQQYRGDYCQYSVQACNVTKTGFNGSYKCNYDGLEAKCKFACPLVTGLQVQGSLDIDYTCKYSAGEFYPKPLPKCVYPPGYILRPGSHSMHHSKTSGYIVGGSGSNFGMQWATERERILAILAKYKDVDRQSEWWSSEESPISPSRFTLYMDRDVNVMIDRAPKPALCTTWGGINMKTFDGLVFKAPLSCSHTLINDKVDATFDITIKECPYGSGYGCAHALKIFWQSIPYTLDNINGSVHLSTPDKELPIPVQVMGMKIIPVAQHLQIQLESVGLQIDWDRHQYLGIHAGPLLWSKVGGLCGSLDGDYKNDLMAKSGVVVETVKSFTDSWRVDDKSDLCTMENSRELDFGSESCEPAKQKKAVEVCSRLQGNEKLEECVKGINFEALLRACVDDYCNCPNREHPETCNCDAISMLAKECIFKGVRLEHGWRDLEICPVSCSYGRVYLPCGPDVEPTCDMEVTPGKGKCNEGCFCPEGTVQYKDACITQELCPCTMRGKEFKPESSIKKKCNTCTCKAGQWKCTDEQCGARCGAIGDPHYQTFDGKRYDFMGQCSYYLLKTPKLSVEAENIACSGAISENLNLVATAENPSCTKSVTLRFTLKNGVPTTVRLNQGMAVHVNEKEITKFPKVLGAGEVLIRQASSSFMTVEFPDGVRIWWDGISRAYIDAPPSYRNQTAGLCGTFNSNTQDDFLTPEGDIETAVEPFADKWRTKDTCDFPTETVSGPHPCSANPAKRADAEKFCNYIMDDIFQDCHWIVEPEQYYEDCLYDVCACKDEPDKCFCPILAAYGTECMRQGIKTGWRMAVKECAVKCPMGQVYDECGDNCARSCSDLATKNNCKKECVEGCRCPHGEYLNENNECVPQHKCSCTYDGISFKPGYKEVRPGEKFQDFCTCTNGLWECEDAEPGDELKYPPSSQLRAECANRPFAEFSKCASKEPKTCKNMHEYVENLEECAPGCVCMSSYVYDTSRKVCVLPENCSCHHGGKSYSDGDKIKEDCNLCTCKSGNWSCSSNGCGSTCSVWGDSHFTTYDNHDFDFQGACDYVLSKGVAENGDGFAVTIQNVLCGTMGVTCSKSVEISLSGSVQDSITLTADPSYVLDPNKSAIKKIRDASNTKGHGAFHIYKAGVFIVVEVIPLKLQVKWDEGTRVYVKLGNEWKNKVKGLCGNYNDNAVDDMQTPSQGIETSPLIFGHAWKVQQFCAQPTTTIDACKEHPQRETWAQLKCGVLKSDIFKDCHAEVSVEKYLKRCIFDTCACDQGGDCECLCTAVGAYAHDCSQKGINIRWRTPHFCPMQCDPHCAEYQACTPACAVETCDNFLDQGMTERMCNQENCIEGCLIKPCDDGMIYLNDTYRECVPKADCKPVCMIRDGKTYYEGDITYTDECATCRCSKKKEVCSGVKCAEPITTERSARVVTDSTTQHPLGTEEQTKCVRGWTRWFDKDTDTSGKLIHLNDEEKLPRYDRMESIYGTCVKKFMKKIECRVVGTHESPDYMDENVRCNLQDGLVCQGQCHDYELRVFCQCDDELLTTPVPTERPQIGQPCNSLIAEYKEYPGDCHKFLHCQPITGGTSWSYVEKTCGEFMMFNPTVYVCDHISTVQQIKPSCGKPLTSAEVETPSECPEGQVMADCANQCEHTCHFYGSILRKRGLCKKGEHCKPGCVEQTRPDCLAMGKYWRDVSTCVEMDECPCMDKSEKYVQPHMPVFGDEEVCQCIDNAYTCVPIKLPEVTTMPTLLTTPAVTEYQPEALPHTLAPHLHCETEQYVPIVEGDQPLPDSAFNASSSLNAYSAPFMARLPKNSKNSLGSWSPGIDDQMQYLQISFLQPEPIYGIIMAGSPDFDNYVTLFKILYSHDGESYHYLVDETDTPQKFNGPLDSRTPQQTMFNIPVEAKSVRIYPLKWHGRIAMRVELLGCGESTTTTTAPATTAEDKLENVVMTTPKAVVWSGADKCVDRMGVDDGKMHAQQVKASSIWTLPQPAKKPRLIDLLKLSSPVGWRPVANTPNEYVQFDFLAPRNVSGFITKGGPDGWVTSFKVMFSKNKLIWNKLLYFDGQPEQFRGNYDSNSEVVNHFRSPILTQYFKIVPSKWENNINMRIEPIGCFETYLEVKEQVPELDKPAPKCQVCDGVLDTGGECKCKNGLLWDGQSCVQSNLCPCVEEYSTYPIGAKYENKLCEECVCVLGGHANCKPKKCPPCVETNLRSLITPDCFCKCEPCPKYQRICPSSGDCIPELLWCNGVQDCADDEDDSCTKKIEVMPQPVVNRNESFVMKCPEPECPPNMKIKVSEKKQRKMSQMFAKSFSDMEAVGNNMMKITKTKVLVSETEEFLMMPTEQVNGIEEEECAEFTCVPTPTKIVLKNETSICMEPKCPENYEIELDMSNAKPGECQKYACVLKPTKDDSCEISGKFITTFDGTEFKYETCSHILARDIKGSNWLITVQLLCEDATRKICHKMVTIKDIESAAILTIMPNMKLNFNGFDYTVPQLMNSPICKAAFVISQPGKTVLVVSRKHGYWILYDDIGYIKIGISSKYLRTVDGLCGYYDGVVGNDKRMPNGTLMQNTMKFGDSWFDKKIPKEMCYPQACPFELQKKALVLCNAIKHPVFVKCNKAVNYKQFVSKCMETTCECLRAHPGEDNTCKCNALQDFVSKCLTINPNIQLNLWRAVQQCEIACPAPLIHSDCYKRRCEPSCDSLNTEDCPVIPDACFPGCYCPESTVRQGKKCITVAECKDCVCNSFGKSQFFTYDKQNFHFNGNCTYLLSRDIVLPGQYNFQVYVTMDYCNRLGYTSNSTEESCVEAFHIFNGDHLIHIERPKVGKVPKILVDGTEVKVSFKKSWINMREVNGKELLLSLLESHVELRVSYDDMVYTLSVPSIKYSGKMEGLCGNCDHNPKNDLIENPAKRKEGKPSDDMATILQSWQADEPKLGIELQSCSSEIIPENQCQPPPPEKDPCQLLYNEELFGRCNTIIDPEKYVALCQKELCKPGNHQQSACNLMSAYAHDCAQQGICLNWRRPDMCPIDCPTDMAYDSCGCAKTCDTIKKVHEYDAVITKTSKLVKTVEANDICLPEERFEGCFCPKGKVMENGECVTEESCVKCDDLVHVPGEKWKKDKCTDCNCNFDGKVECVEQKCLIEENICAEGFTPKKIESPDQCCARYRCVPEPKLPPAKVCLEPLMPICGPGQFKKQKTGADGCPQFICECKPKEECEQLELPRALKPGEKIVEEELGCCPTQEIVCDVSTCPPALKECAERFYEVVRKQEVEECCPHYMCEPPKNMCIVQNSQGEKFIKPLNAKWPHPTDPCKQEMCVYGPSGSTQIIISTETCDTFCPRGFTYTNKQPALKCCGECVQEKCVLDEQLYEENAIWTSADNCTIYSCVRKGEVLIVSSAQETCPDVSACPAHLLVASEGGCCKLCNTEPVFEEQKNCLPVSLAESLTLELIEISQPGVGNCVNKQPIQGFTECDGACNSGSKYNKDLATHESHCHCCSIKSWKTVEVPLICENGKEIIKKVDVPASCGCSPCAENTDYGFGDKIDIRLNTLPKLLSGKLTTI
ncbi:hemocytin isoform X2 [Eurosta solidaginis]|uniref:hemocytin isoform X2 n=1 Tax=Eurosta solidaginis TaxID=178769 RepID=UPI0035316BA2